MINLSLEFYARRHAPATSRTSSSARSTTRTRHDVVVVAAAGNEGVDPGRVPGARARR